MGWYWHAESEVQVQWETLEEVSEQLHLPAVLSTALDTARVSEDEALYVGLRTNVTQIQTTRKPTICTFI